MSDFEKLQEEVKQEEELSEEELYGETQNSDEEEQEQPKFDFLDNMKLEDALFFIGLAGAKLRKAPNPTAFASTYSTSMSQWLKMIGFEWALKSTLKEVKLNPKAIFIIGGISMVLGIWITPADVGGEQSELADSGKIGFGKKLFRKALS